jgi:N6-L-threonylcarbamoyladenine synthase
MRILGIETSCDDTAIGIVSLARDRFNIESRAAASQILLHRKFGGVVPEVAAREHALTIHPTLRAAMRLGHFQWRDIEAIAVTSGPGLSTALGVGVETARTLAYALHKPLVAVNHIEGHISSAWASPEAGKIKFPAVALVVSGGHTELISVKKFGQYKLLGRTIDDAAGEAFDKTAKLLKLPYPGGPEISKLAAAGDPKRFKFPRSMLGKDSLDFSYAGLKTSVLYATMKLRKLNKQTRADLAAGFEAAAIEPLVEKSRRALARTKAKTLIVAGGVAANRKLRHDLANMVMANFPGVAFISAPLDLCMDNGVMIAIAGAFRAQKRHFMPWQKLHADPNWELV